MGIRAALAALLISILCRHGLAQSQRHDSLIVVPAPGPVVIDGDLKDWDLSGAIDSAYDESLKPRFSARFASMYDANAFYIAAHVVDDSPMANVHDPKIEPNNGWQGDCLQVRLASDPKLPRTLDKAIALASDRVCHLTIWYFSGRQEPELQIQHGMDFHGTQIFSGADSGVAFKKDADGNGYTVEARIPWGRLHAQPDHPKAGDSVALTLQPLWGDAAGRKNVMSYYEVVQSPGFAYQSPEIWGRANFSTVGHLAPADRPLSLAASAQPLTLDVPLADSAATQLSAAVFNSDGALVRTLPVELLKGENKLATIHWDGCDDEGQPLPAGKYQAHFLTHRGIGQKWIASLHNAGNPPWVTDDGRGSWGGDHGNPLAAASDAQRVYLGWEISEAGWSQIAVDPKFVSSERAQKLWGQHQVLECGIFVQAMACDGTRLFVGQDGYRWGQQETDPSLRDAGVVLWDGKTGAPVNFPFGQRILVVSRHLPKGDGINLKAIAVSGDLLYCSLIQDNKVAVFDWKTGKPVKDYSIPAPIGLAVDSQQRVLVASEKSVLRIDPVSGQVTPFVKGSLSAPFGLAMDAEGRLYVSDRGTAMQVRIFDRDGKPAGDIGKPGGRPAVGTFDPQGLYNPAGLTVDGEGKVWVTEQDFSPRRVSVWSRDGKLIADLLGPGNYAVDGTADEQHPELINTHNTLFEVDYATGKTRTVATLLRAGPGELHSRGSCSGRSLKFRHTRGHDYLIDSSEGASIIFLQGAQGVGKPVAAIGDWWHLRHFHAPPELLAKIPVEGGAFVWTDLNGDGKAQPEEFTVEPTSVPAQVRNYWGPSVDDDLGFWGTQNNKVFHIAVKEFRPDGTPVYPRPSECKPFLTSPDRRFAHAMPTDGGVYVLDLPAGDGSGPTAGAVSRYSADGRCLWSYRKAWLEFAWDAPLFQPGYVIGAMKFIGKAKLDSGIELIGVNGYPGQFNLLTDGGLWVAALCHDNRYGPLAGPNTVWPENFSGFLFRNKNNGKVYLIAGDSDTRIWEVTGLDLLRKGEYDFSLSDADHGQAVAAAVRRLGGNGATHAPITLSRAQNIVVDGNLADWDLHRAVTIDGGAGRTATAAVAYDDARLYAAFNVNDDSPMQNGAKDFGLLFKSGDVCELMLTTNRAADPKRSAAAAGDLRLMFSVMDGKPVCVAMIPKSADGARQPRTFSSPTGSIVFDRVFLVSDANVQVTRRAGGYTLEASVPLAEIGFVPMPGTTIAGDLGVLFSDSGGTAHSAACVLCQPPHCRHQRRTQRSPAGAAILGASPCEMTGVSKVDSTKERHEVPPDIFSASALRRRGPGDIDRLRRRPWKQRRGRSCAHPRCRQQCRRSRHGFRADALAERRRFDQPNLP